MSSQPKAFTVPGRRERLLRGGLQMSIVSVANRMSSLVAQLFLGRLLLEEDFGLFAVAFGITGVGSGVRSVLQPVLIEQLENDEAAFGRTYRTMMVSLWVLAVAGIAATPLISAVLNEPGLEFLLIVMLLSMPFQVLPVFGLARLSHNLDFGSFSKIVTIAGFLRHAATVCFAVFGAKAFSFALGAIVAGVVELVAITRYTELLPKPGIFSTQTLVDVRGSVTRIRVKTDRRWIWLSALALSLWVNGDYTAAGLFAGTTIIGLYYFAYNLTAAFALPLNMAVNTVLVPGFVAIKNEVDRRDRFIETISLLSVLGVLLFNSVAVTIAPLTHFLWSGKWDASIIALLVFTLFAPIQMIHPVTLAIERGSGMWNLYFSDIVSAGFATVTAAAIGAYLGGLAHIVWFVVLAKVAVTMLSLYRLSARVGNPYLEAVRSVALPWLLGMVSLAGAHMIQPLDDPSLRGALIRLPLFAILTILLVVLPYRSTLLDATRAIAKR